MIQDDHLPTLTDLIHHIKELTLPGSGRKLLKSDYDSPTINSYSDTSRIRVKIFQLTQRGTILFKSLQKMPLKDLKYQKIKSCFQLLQSMEKD